MTTTLLLPLRNPLALLGARVCVPRAETMTKTVEVSRGMARKLERHMPLKLRLLGKCFVATGVILLMVLTFLWSQYLFPTMLDAHVAFDVRSYRAFLRFKLDVSP